MHPRPPSRLHRGLVAACLGFLAIAVGVVHADEPGGSPLAPQAPVLDGSTAADEGWRGARILPVGSVPVPAAPPATGDVRLDPRVAITAHEGYLFARFEVDEDPSPLVGVTLFITADPDADSAADATEISYRPASLRARTWTIRHQDGVGRGVVPVRGAADVVRPGQWRIELAVPLAPLLQERASTSPLRLGAAIHTRTPGIVASSPEGAFLRGPEAWHTLEAPEGGWPLAELPLILDVAEQEAREDRRMAAWHAFKGAMHGSGQLVLPSGEPEKVVEVVEEVVLGPLESIRALRPDLGPAVDYQAADVFRQLGLHDRARERLTAMRAAAPGWREGRFLQDVALDGYESTPRDPSVSSDFTRWTRELDARAKAIEGDPYKADGLAAARAVLAYKEGRFLEARPEFERLAAQYPSYRLGRRFLAWAREGQLAEAGEATLARRRAGKSPLRMTLKTSRGELVFALDPEAAPNAVNQIVWLGKKGFYNGTRFHRAVPFFGLQGGDPFTRPADAGGKPEHVGRGYPGYAVHADGSKRAVLRGRIAFVRIDESSIGSQFFITTGSALHLRGEMVVFGHLLEGLDVLGQLVKDDVVEGVTFEGLDPAWTYEPVDHSGSVPDAPRAEVLGG